MIRRMRDRDLDAVVAIERASFATPWSRESFRQELLGQANGSCCSVIEVDGEVVGYLIAWFIHDEVHLANIAVAEAHRRRGHAQRLIQWLIDAANQASMRCILLEVRVSNDAAIAIYLRFGFRPFGIRRGYYREGSKSEDAQVMLLDLSATG
jgi:ribosomal-protein-alanine N-acetyltransferase